MQVEADGTTDLLGVVIQQGKQRGTKRFADSVVVFPEL
jgi:hypothetical protein